jgi:hypothetical protein
MEMTLTLIPRDSEKYDPFLSWIFLAVKEKGIPIT